MFDVTNPLTEASEQKDIWLKDKQGNCYFFPKGWAGENDSKEEEKPELYGYYPTRNTPNSPVSTGWVLCEDAEKLTETTEEDARASHPALAAYLDKINGPKKAPKTTKAPKPAKVDKYFTVTTTAIVKADTPEAAKDAITKALATRKSIMTATTGDATETPYTPPPTPEQPPAETTEAPPQQQEAAQTPPDAEPKTGTEG